MNYWLVKTEPGNYSIDDLKRDKKTSWDGVRNYQARNFLKTMKPGDLALIYHSVKERSVVGVGKVGSVSYIDPTDKTSQFCAVDMEFVEKFKVSYCLDDMRLNKKLSDMLLMKQSRLSVMPVTKSQWDEIVSHCS